MKTIIVSFTLLCFALNASSQNPEEDLVKQTIQSAYVDGLLNEGDFRKVDQGFHPKFELRGIADSANIWILTLDAWKEKIRERKNKGQLPRSEDTWVNIKFLDVEVNETVASARFEFYMGGKLAYIDYMLLYKFGDQWKIMNKAYYQVPL